MPCPRPLPLLLPLPPSTQSEALLRDVAGPGLLDQANKAQQLLAQVICMGAVWLDVCLSL